MANNTSNHPHLQQQQPLYEYLSQNQSSSNSFGRGIGYWPHSSLLAESQHQQNSLTKFQSLSSGSAAERYTDGAHQHDNTSLLSGQSMNSPQSASVRHGHGIQQCASKIVPGNSKATASSNSSSAAAGVGGTAKLVGNDNAMLSPVAAQCPGEMNVGTLMNRFPTSSASFSLAATRGGSRGGGAATGENGATNHSGNTGSGSSSGSSSLGRSMDSNNNNNNQSGGATAVTPVASSQSAPFNASTSSLHPPNNHHHHHQHHHAIHQPTLSNYQYHALLHDRLTAPLSSSSCNPSGPNHSSSFTCSTHSSSGIPNRPVAHPPVTVTSRLGGGGSSNYQSAGAGLLKESSSGGGEVLKGPLRSGTTKVQLMNKHLMDADRDILHSLMMSGSASGGGNHNENLVDSTSPPPELLRNLYGEGGATKRNYSPSQFANLCNAVVASNNGTMQGSCGAGSSNSGVGAGSGACGRSSNSSSNCDSEQVPGLLSSMVGVGGAQHQGTEKKIPNSIRGDDENSWERGRRKSV